MEQTERRKNMFTDCSDNDSEYEINDQDLSKILIVTLTPPYMRKHLGRDRTGTHVSWAKITSELAKVIDGLYYHEQDLQMEGENTHTATKVTPPGQHLSADSLHCLYVITCFLKVEGLFHKILSINKLYPIWNFLEIYLMVSTWGVILSNILNTISVKMLFAD